MEAITVFSPAKLNLFLAVTGRRTDGFHDLLSLAVKLEFGDRLTCTQRQGGGSANGGFTLASSDPRVPLDETNLILRAARRFREATGWPIGVDFHLEKQIPMGAGLGGGSSNAVAALKGLNALAGEPLGAGQLAELAGDLGSDCPLFLSDGPVIMRGRGERVESLGASPAAVRLRARRVLVFKPDFPIPTAWAYGRMAQMKAGGYLGAEAAEGRLAAWLAKADASADKLLFNNLEAVAFEKFLALPVLLDRLRADFGLAPLMTGSGSACFAFLPESGGPTVEKVTTVIREAWGSSALALETRIG